MFYKTDILQGQFPIIFNLKESPHKHKWTSFPYNLDKPMWNIIGSYFGFLLRALQ